ncbi:hypothetical protein CC80DRAFT_590645 [Byssothecium circinans]|uniref:VWFA domain-containing protein n=1 Tax=Byssothecium circinans TaxID=147558 RepID=A0A6A5U8S5_9PLEO|nr:hypothetical protein CC80DRAFT_590645 [Byssothecium circinans]
MSRSKSWNTERRSGSQAYLCYELRLAVSISGTEAGLTNTKYFSDPKAKLAVAALAPWLISLSACSPFGTVNSPTILHQHNEHQMITRLALQCQGDKSDGVCFEAESLNNLAGIIGENGAVGSPDTLPPEDSEAHCDDADFLNIPGYPRTRGEATAQLQRCVDHLRMRFIQGVNGAGRMVDDDNKVIEDEVDLLSSDYCDFSHRDASDDTSNRAKCTALEGLGRALHGTEDFYSHSNWADKEDTTRAISVLNPPGLANTSPAPFMDLRATSQIVVPQDLTTGCFNVAEVLPGNGGTGSFGCRDRVIHLNLNKDHGVVNPAGGGSVTPDSDGVPRSAVPGNFAAAVRVAALDARERWKNFRDELRIQHGTEKSNLIICAMVRDDPAKDCRNRKIAIVVDSSGSNTITDPSNLRIRAAKDFNAKLLTVAQAGQGVVPDKVAVVDFDDSARLLYGMGDPSGAALIFDAIDSSGGTNIGTGIALGIDEIMKDQPGVFAKRSGMIVLTDGEDFSPANQVLQLARARLQGIRVNYGFLTTPTNPVTKRSLAKRDPDPNVVAAILSTGGTFAIIQSAKAQKNFIDLVVARGATDIDGVVDSTLLTSGVTVTEHITSNKTSHQFTYSASSGEAMNFTLAVVTTGQTVFGVLRDIRENVDVATLNATSRSPSTIRFAATKKTELELIVSSPSANLTEIIFSVGMDTNMADKNETTTSSSTMPSSTSSVRNATSSTYYPTVNVTKTNPSASYSTALNTNSSGIHYNPTSIIPYPSSKPSQPIKSSSGIIHYTHISTSVCTTTSEVTTVCDGPLTRTLTIYPTSRYTDIVTSTIKHYPTAPACPSCNKPSSKPSAHPPATSSPPSYESWVSSAYECLKTGAPTAYPSNPAPGYSRQHSSASSGPKYSTIHNPSKPPHSSAPGHPPALTPQTVKPSSNINPPTYGTPAPGSQYTKVTVTYLSSPTGSVPSSVYPVNPPPAPPVGTKGTSVYVQGNANATATTNGTVPAAAKFTGGAMVYGVGDVLGGMVGAVVAVVGFGL